MDGSQQLQMHFLISFSYALRKLFLLVFLQINKKMFAVLDALASATASDNRINKSAESVLTATLPDPLMVLQAKDTFIQGALASANQAAIAMKEAILQTPSKRKGKKKSADLVADANLPTAKLSQEPPNLPSVRPGLSDLRSKYHQAIKQGNTYDSPDTIKLSLSLKPADTAPMEPAIKPQPNFQLYASRTQDSLRPISLKDGTMGKATSLESRLKKQEPTPKERATYDPILQNLTPVRASLQHFENFNFCSEMKKGTEATKVPLTCVQERFIAAGGAKTGLLYPAEGTNAYLTFYSQATFGDMMALLEDVVGRLQSMNKQEQANARRALFGAEAIEGMTVAPAPLQSSSHRRPPNGAELFIRVGPSRILIHHRIIQNGVKIPSLAVSEFIGAAGEAAADFLIVGSIWSEEPHRWRLAQKISTGMTTIFNKELWDFERLANDSPGDFRNLAPGKYIANACTPIYPLQHNYFKLLWSKSESDELLVEDCTSASKEPQSIPANIVCLTQDAGAPMLNFAIYDRQRGEPPPGTYSNPQFLPTFGTGRRFEEFRNPDIFYSLIHDIQIDSSPRSDIPEYNAYAVFKTHSFWQCTTPIAPLSWRTITLAVSFDTLPTAGKQPMRCVAAAYPFFLYLAYTPANKGIKQGVYLYLYRLKDSSYTVSRLPIQKAVVYFISIRYEDGIPGKMILEVAPYAAARADRKQLEKSAAALEVHDNVMYAISPVEGGALTASIQHPFLSLGFQKYGLGTPGFNGRVAYVHVFDYSLKVADYEREINNNWNSSWFH